MSIRLNLHYFLMPTFAVCLCSLDNWQRKRSCLVIFRRLRFGCQAMFSCIVYLIMRNLLHFLYLHTYCAQ